MTVTMRSILGLAPMPSLARSGAAGTADAEVPGQKIAANLNVHPVIANIDQGAFDPLSGRVVGAAT